jgi:hypothetical protein
MIAVMVSLTACDLPTPPGPPDHGEEYDPVIMANLVAEYEARFQLAVPFPAYFSDPDVAAMCQTVPSYLTTTAYLRGPSAQANVNVMHLEHTGSGLVVNSRGRSHYSKVVNAAPAGTFKVLTALLTYPQTVNSADLPILRAQQFVINQQHAAFALNQGFANPIVQFEFTNVAIAGALIVDPRSPSSVKQTLALEGYSADGYDFLVVINIDPLRSEGGFAGSDALGPLFVYMGNFSQWHERPLDAEWETIARAAYHHEVAHHWGWEHEWSAWCGTGQTPWWPFIAAPALFGWTDTDGDGVPEILDATPYGRTG